MNGIINFLKPPGMSSNGAVVYLRGVLGVRKTGHAGTLDPGACGVLPICVGKGTKISSYLMGGKKEYIAEVAFAFRTDTGDSYGNVTGTSDAPFPSESEVRRALSTFAGRITQQTPAYSAVKHEGRRLYQLAREGEIIPPKSREVHIFETEYMAQTREDAHLFRVVCSKGTYIRTLCEDIGEQLGTLAYMSFLVRSKCAGLGIEDAMTADELKSMGEDKSSILLPIDRFLQDLPRIDTNTADRKALFNGLDIAHSGDRADKVRIYSGEELMGIGRLAGGRLKITTRLVDE